MHIIIMLSSKSVTTNIGSVLEIGTKFYNCTNATGITPVVNNISGTQVVLAPVMQNEGKDWTEGLPIYTYNGAQYYILNRVGLYKDVYVGGMRAGKVEVSNISSGKRTLIYWYITGTYSSATSLSVQTLVSFRYSGIKNVSNRSCNTYAYIGDHEYHRLYGGHTSATINYNWKSNYKYCVTARGETPSGDSKSTSATLKEATNTTYRLEFNHSTSTDHVMTYIGSVDGVQPEEKYNDVAKIYDRLPRSTSQFRWQKGVNISVQYVDDHGEDYTDYTFNIDGVEYKGVESPNDWYLSDNTTTTDTNSGTSQFQYLVWGKDFRLNVYDRNVYVYVTITMPTGDEFLNYSYTVANSGTDLYNYFYYWNNNNNRYDYSSVSATLQRSLTLNKVIVTRGSTPSNDTSRSSTYIGRGAPSTLTYRVTISPNGSLTVPVRINKSMIYDQLPSTVSGYRWVKGENVVNLSFVDGNGNDYSNHTFTFDGEEYTALKNGDDWDIYSNQNGTAQADSNQQYIVWGDDFELLVYDVPVYMYVTLKYPTDQTFNDYISKMGTTSYIDNRIYVTGISTYARNYLISPYNTTIAKYIVTSQGTTPGNDSTAIHTYWGEGETVTYRIGLYLSGSSDYSTITNDYIYDMLPKSSSNYKWSKDNVVNLRYVDANGNDLTQKKITVYDREVYQVEHGDDWYISDSNSSVTETSTSTQQYLVWGDDFRLYINNQYVYIYVTLKTPAGRQWSNYISELPSNTAYYNSSNTFQFYWRMKNSFYIRGKGASTVYHNVIDISYITPTKMIVTNRGTTASNDSLTDLSTIGMDQDVTYRILLSSSSSKSTTIDRRYIYDTLPATTSSFKWSKDRVRIEYRDAAGNDLTLKKITLHGQEYPVVEHGDDWYISDSSSGITDTITGNQQYIVWGNDFLAHVSSGQPIYMYITVHTPENELWEKYVDETSRKYYDNYPDTPRRTFYYWVTNSFKVSSRSSIVYHDFVSPYLTSVTKQIVKESGDIPSQDVVTGSAYVGRGDVVTFRIQLQTSAGPYYGIVKNKYVFYDRLPATTASFKWSEKDVLGLKFVDAEGNDLTKKTVSIGGKDVHLVQNADKWYISDSSSSATENITSNQQYIVWDDDFKLYVNNQPAYLYITLKFPRLDTWDDYVDELTTGYLYNYFYCRDRSSAVTLYPISAFTASVQKQIVTSKGDKPEDDALVSSLSIGRDTEVTYRVKLWSSFDPEYVVVKSKHLYDQLPGTSASFKWTEDYVYDLKFVDADGNDLVGKKYSVDGVEFDAIQNADHWHVSDSTTTASTTISSNQQYIMWDNDFKLYLNDEPIYMYVTLKTPDRETWKAHLKSRGKSYWTVYNYFRIGNNSSSVSHTLLPSGDAIVKTGVIATGTATSYSGNNIYTSTYNLREDSRLYYHNDDNSRRTIDYYISIYNDGADNLYLNNIVDILPKGFTYGGYVNTTTTESYNNYSDSTQRTYRYRYKSGSRYYYSTSTLSNTNNHNYKNYNLIATILPKTGQTTYKKAYIRLLLLPEKMADSRLHSPCRSIIIITLIQITIMTIITAIGVICLIIVPTPERTSSPEKHWYSHSAALPTHPIKPRMRLQTE